MLSLFDLNDSINDEEDEDLWFFAGRFREVSGMTAESQAEAKLE